MAFEAVRLQSWYATPLGQMVAGRIGAAIERWLEGRMVELTIGLGFCQPYLELISRHTTRLVGAAPAEMGVARWPHGKPNRISLVRTDALPYPDESFDRVVMTHLLEGSASPHATLRETWRVLKPGGRLLLVVPNRGGWWARRDSTPFGWGRPFSSGQLREHLHDGLFIPQQAGYALFTPPFTGERWLRASPTWEKVGERWFAPLGGVILCDAEKVVYAATPLAVNGLDLAVRRLPDPVLSMRSKHHHSL